MRCAWRVIPRRKVLTPCHMNSHYCYKLTFLLSGLAFVGDGGVCDGVCGGSVCGDGVWVSFHLASLWVALGALFRVVVVDVMVTWW